MEGQQLPLSGLPLPERAAVLTDNPREIRIISGLACAPLSREELDRLAGASNGPDAIKALRRKGLAIPCCREAVADRDGEIVFRGRYRFTEEDRARTAHIWKVSQ